MTKPTKTRRRFMALQKQETIDLCLQEWITCNAVAQRLGLLFSSLARAVHTAEGLGDQRACNPKGGLMPSYAKQGLSIALASTNLERIVANLPHLVGALTIESHQLSNAALFNLPNA